MLTNHSENKWKNMCILHLVKSYNLVLNPHKKKNTSVLELIIFYETRADNPKKDFGVLSCFIYTIIKNCVCIDCLDCQ